MKKLSFLFAALVAGVFGLSANADILVSEGCDTTKDYTSVGVSGSGLLGNYPKSWTANIGIMKDKKWSGYGSQPKAYPYDLPLPECFAAAGITSKGAACVGHNSGANQTDHRWGYLALATDKLKIASGTTIYLRALMSVDSGAASTLSKPKTDTIGNGNTYGCGISTRPSSSGGTGGSPLNAANGVSFCFWRDSTDKFNLSVKVLDSGAASSSKRILSGMTAPTGSGPTAGNTFVCVAEIQVGAGAEEKEIVRAFASPSGTYDPASVVWTDPIEAEIISDTAYPTDLNFVGDYQPAGLALFDEYMISTEISDVMVVAKAGSPKLTNAALSGDSGDYSVSAMLSAASATDAGAVAHDGAGDAKVLSAGPVTVGDDPVEFSKAFSDDDLDLDKTYQVFAYAENDVALVSNAVGVVYTGLLSLEKVRDADEYKCVPGEVTVSRATADPYPLTVDYTFTSEAAGAAPGKTWVAPQPIVIPANAASATIKLIPIVDASIAEDIIVTLSIKAGNYPVVTQTVDLKIKNLVAPEGYNTWVAATSGKASVAGNWSAGRPPISTDKVLFDGDFSQMDCEWDAGTDGGPSASVASFETTGSFAGNVVIATQYPEVTGASFTTFGVTGDMKILGGNLTQVSNDVQKEEYRLNVAVGGNLEIGSAGRIDVTGRGPRGVMSGRSENVYAGDQGTYQKTYGDPKRPYYCGSGNNGAWPTSYKGSGGGAAWIEVSGTATVNGKILSEGSILNSNMSTFDGKNGNISTSGGSVYLKASALTGDGNGLISAKCEFSCNSDNQIGSGGRVAVELTTTAYDFDSGAVQFKANANAKQAGSPGHGTIVIKNPGEANGTLYVLGKYDRTFSYNNCEYTYQQTTAIPKGDTWTFDKVVIGDFGMITVGEGSTLSLPNGWASVYSMNNAKQTDMLKKYACGIILRGGTLNVPAVGGKHEFKNGAWTFHPTDGFVLDANTEISGKANVGAMYLSSGTNTVMICDVKVQGNLDVKSDGYMSAVYGGIGGTATYAGEAYTPFHKNTVAFGTGHGGQNAHIGAQNLTYGSFFDPVLPGTPAGHADVRYVGGGVIKLEVAGTLNVDGRIFANSGWDGQYWSDRPSAPGSVNIVAGKLTGSGTIEANGAAGYVGTYPKTSWETQGPSGGGRVAVRLTGSGSTFADFDETHITAKGVTASGTPKSDTADANIVYSSAGSVYLQTAAEQDKYGTLVIRNDGKSINTAYTPLPAAEKTDVIADFKKASLSLLDCGKVRLYETLTMANLTLAENCQLDLNGNTLTVNTAKLGGTKLKPGEYAASAYPDFLTGEGSLVVKGSGMMLLVR